MEVIGTIASGVQLAILFKGCLVAFDFIETTRHYAYDYKKCVVKLEIQKCRLRSWGEAMGLTQSSPSEAVTCLELHRFHRPISDSLNLLRSILSDGAKLKSRYGCQKPFEDRETRSLASRTEYLDQNTVYEITNGTPHADQRHMHGHNLRKRNPSPMFDQLRPSKRFKASLDSHQRTTSFAKKMRWVIHDKRKFELLIDEVTELVDGLHSLTGYIHIKDSVLKRWEQMIEINHQAIHLYAPQTFSLGDELNARFTGLRVGSVERSINGSIEGSIGGSGYVSFEELVEDSDSLVSINWSDENERLGRYNNATSSTEVALSFVSHCFLSYIFGIRGISGLVDHAAHCAFEGFERMITQRHPQALICLYHVSSTLSFHDQSLAAVKLLGDARNTALRQLKPDDAVIQTIDFMIAQAASTIRESGMSITRLWVVYTMFRDSVSVKHPYTLIAGYNLACRLAMEDDNARFQAHQLLFALQENVDSYFGPIHVQTLAFLTSRVRMLHGLQRWVDAEKLMSEAITRVQVVFPPQHPLLMEYERRHAVLLSRLGNTTVAEQVWIRVALARVGIFGLEHELSRNSVRDVESFLLVGRRRQREYRLFKAQLEEAAKRSEMHDIVFSF